MTTATIDIEQLVQGCISNQRKAQEQFYRAFYSFSMTIALRYSRDEHDAADILSNAFVKIFKSLRSFDQSKGSLHAWIKRIVINESLDHVKGRARFSESVEIEDAPAPIISNHAIESMGADEIMMIIRKLPPATHAVFVLYAIEGFNHREIAEKTGISEGTSKWHLSEARKILKQLISETTAG